MVDTDLKPNTPGDFVTVHFAGRLPKRVGKLTECEDAFVVGELSGDLPMLRVAVADGASQCLFSSMWAESVASAFVTVGTGSGGRMSDLNDALAHAAGEWLAYTESQPLPWYAEPKRGLGAYATLAGVEVRDDGKWKGTAVGDSCIFQVRNRRLIAGLPIEAHEAFPDLPILVGTNEAHLPADGVIQRISSWLPGDDLYLMTDALAKWFLYEVERGMEPWRWIEDIGVRQKPLETLAERLNVMREAGRIVDDDVTLIHLHFPKSESEESIAEAGQV